MISKVTLRLTPQDDGSHYSCRANHPALNTPMRASVKISVQCDAKWIKMHPLFR
ncbi:hypothetical protein E2C01_098598 [Portunus trituberculatus]|uniref:Ig-like domain-containing protein n=1 Tax=Portunus trituberculatus TaxID=210409 RepID=A0A5B7KEK2_PORTR|nr:hypothetical protein [Portunus trituberculatus]